MITELKLKEICEKYEINFEKLINTNENILNYGEYSRICWVLDFLRDEVNIMPRNIEKCPSILYFVPENIKKNWDFLNKQEITISNIEGCLHVLSEEPIEVENTYNYILENYGIRYLNALTSILRVPVSRIRKIENKFPEFKKKNILQAAYSRFSIEEIEKIVKVCKENGIELTGSVFRQSAEEIEKIVKVCQENGIELTGSVFFKSAEEIEKIVKVCKENGIELTGSVFLKSAKQLQENIDYIKENYGAEYLQPLIVSKNIKNLEKVLPYLKEQGVLEVVIGSSSILTLTLEEIKERKQFIERIGETIVKANGKAFNSIFGLSKKNYAKKVKEYELKSTQELSVEVEQQQGDIELLDKVKSVQVGEISRLEPKNKGEI